MDSTIYTAEMLGQGGGSDQYVFLLFGFASSSVEPGGGAAILLMGVSG